MLLAFLHSENRPKEKLKSPLGERVAYNGSVVLL